MQKLSITREEISDNLVTVEFIYKKKEKKKDNYCIMYVYIYICKMDVY